MGDHVHPSWVEPDEERFAVVPRLVHKLEGIVTDNTIDRLHVKLNTLDRMRRQRALVLDALLADLALAGIYGCIVAVDRKCVKDVARANLIQKIFRVVRVPRILHRIEMI